MSFHYIDMENYKRRAHFEYFSSLPYPYAGITVNIDVTDALQYSRTKKHSFYLTILHAAALAADGVDEFRQRIRDDQIIEYSECPTSHVELLEDSSYCYCTLHHHMDLEEYFTQAEKIRKACRENGINEDAEVESAYFVSVVPWLHYTAMIQPVAGGKESNPRLTWGRYDVNENGRFIMPFSVLANHALVDGIHISHFYENLDREILKYKSLL